MMAITSSKVIAIIAMAITLSACGQRHDLPEGAIVVPTGSEKDLLGRRIVTLRTFYNPGSAISELNTATCKVSADGPAITVKPPIKLAVPVALHQTPTIKVQCDAVIGPREIEANFNLVPTIPNPMPSNTVDEVYAQRISLRFF